MFCLFAAILETIIDLSSYNKEDDIVPGLSPLALTKDKVNHRYWIKSFPEYFIIHSFNSYEKNESKNLT